MLRTGLATILLVLLLPVLVAANASTWALRTVLDSGTFSTTVGRALDAPTLERALAVTLADGIVDRIELAPPLYVAELARRVGLGTGADPDAVRAALSERILDAMRDPAVGQVRDEVIASAHGYVLEVAEGEGGLISVQGTNVVLDTGQVLGRIARVADPRVAALVVNVPASLSQPVVVAQVTDLQPIQTALTAMETMQVLLPLVAMTAMLIIVLLAHRRARALGIVGFAVAIAGLLSLLAVWSAGRYVSAVPDAEVAQQLTREVYDAFLDVLVAQSIILVAVGLALAVVGWYAQVRNRRRATARMLGPRY
jgi:hypothetical protein